MCLTVCMRIGSIKSLTRHASTKHNGSSDSSIFIRQGRPRRAYLHHPSKFSNFLIEILPRHQRAQPRNESEFYLDNVTSKLGRTGNICSAREIFTLFLPVLIENQERPEWNIYVNTWALNWCLDLETSHSCVTFSSREQDQMKRELCYAMRNAGLPVSLCVVSSNHSFYNYE